VGKARFELRQEKLIFGGLPVSAPLGAVVDNPIGQSAFETNIESRFFRFDPFVFQNLTTLGLKFTIQSRVSDEVATA
jgi:hypothetical protein